MTNMAAMPIFVKNLKKFSPPEPIYPWPWNVLRSIMYVSTAKVVQIKSLVCPWLILRQGQFGHIGFCMGKSENYLFFLETVAALGLKVSWSIYINEFMKLNEYQRSRSFFDFGQRSLRFQS